MPERCPECGRFLAADFVEGLAEEPAPCPRCETVLSAQHFRSGDPSTPQADADSVRPPDLPEREVRSATGDVLSGWDEGPAGTTSTLLEEIAAGRNLGIVAAIIGAGVAGGLAAGVVASRRRPAWTVAGTLVGAALAVLGSRVLEDRDTFLE